jgi:hypothetical protein
LGLALLLQARRFQPALTWAHGIALLGASLPRGNSAGGAGDWLALADGDAEAVGPDAEALLVGALAEAVGWPLGDAGVAVRSECLARSRTVSVPAASSKMTRMASNQGPRDRRGRTR